MIVSLLKLQANHLQHRLLLLLSAAVGLLLLLILLNVLQQSL